MATGTGVKYIENPAFNLALDVGNSDNVGISGLALLAFLGAGHTEKHGTYKETVQRGVAWLISTLKENGRWDLTGAKQNYRNGIGTMALSEAAGMGRVPATVKAAQRAVNGLVDGQKPYEAGTITRTRTDPRNTPRIPP